MGSGDNAGANLSGTLPPPPPVVPTNVTRIMEGKPDALKKSSSQKLVPMARRGSGTRGQKLALYTNHFQVSISYEDGQAAEAKGIGRRVMDRAVEIYHAELGGKTFAFDGEKSLFTLGPLPLKKHELIVVLDEQPSHRTAGNLSSNGNESPSHGDKKRLRRPQWSKTYKVVISYAAKVPLQAIADALRGKDSENFQEAVRVLDIVLRQHAAKQGCLLVRQSFFRNEPRNFTDIGGGVLGCRGFHSSFRATQGGLSLNIDVSTTMIVQPGPVVDFLIANLNVRDPYQIDWAKAKRMLKNLRIRASPSNLEYKITGLSERPCKEQMFELRQKSGDGQVQSVEITVLDYFQRLRNIQLRYSGDFPCINIGRPKKPTYIPLELCNLVSLQRYTKALSGQQRANLVEKSRQKPRDRMNCLSDALRSSNYGADPLLRSSGISINSQFTQIDGRILSAPKLRVGNGEDFVPRNGRWNFNNKTLFEPVELMDRSWAIANFSTRCDTRGLVRDLIKCAEKKGIRIGNPCDVFEESPQLRRAPPSVRVDKMIEIMKKGMGGEPRFLLCILAERKNSDVYGPWKGRILAELGIVTQCIAPTRVNDQYLTNVLLKINAKLGGINSLLSVEYSKSIPLVSSVPTLILGMDVSHGSPSRADVPSIAAVVSSLNWPSVSRYRASVRTQSPKLEMIDSLYKPTNAEPFDDGMMREALFDFYCTSGKRKPQHIIVFRDGVSESQFNQILNIELEQIKQACVALDKGQGWFPKFTLIIAQKNHHTKFFQLNSPDNVPPGTVIDNKICHPRNNDFYMCAHAGMIGTTRPTHYHVLSDEIGFSADDLQELVHSLCYVYQRSTTAVSVVAPVCYAHLAASQMSQFIKFDDFSESSSSGHRSAGAAAQVPQLPRLSKKVSRSMFFC